jgi:uncharacterized protein (TIGR03435 family)
MRTILRRREESQSLLCLRLKSTDRGFSRIAAIASAGPLLVAIGFLNQPGTAQSTETRAEFEAASIKPFPHPVTENSTSYNAWRAMARSSSRGRFNLVMVTLKGLVLAAYDVNDFQIVGGPSWMDNDGYDVVAKAGSDATYTQMKPMLQTLLADRFKLALHRESKELPVYELSVAKGGPKIVATKEGSCAPLDLSGPPPPLGTKICGGVARRLYELTSYAVSMPEFVGYLAAIMGRPVIDKTGFKDRFDVDLKFDPCSTPGGLGGATPPGLQDQLGLRLQSAKGPVEVLVIDHAERPTAN